MTCITCRTALSDNDLSKGCRRCEGCRKEAPGRPLTPRQQRTWGTVVAPKPVVPVHAKSSWWMEAPPDGFTLTALARQRR